MHWLPRANIRLQGSISCNNRNAQTELKAKTTRPTAEEPLTRFAELVISSDSSAAVELGSSSGALVSLYCGVLLTFDCGVLLTDCLLVVCFSVVPGLLLPPVVVSVLVPVMVAVAVAV